MIIYASKLLKAGDYHIFQLVFYEEVFIWGLHILSKEPLSILKLPPDRPLKYNESFFYLDFFESDLDGD